MRAAYLLLAVAAALSGCTTVAPAPSTAAPVHPQAWGAPVGINEIFSGPIEAAPGHDLVMGDLVMPAGREIPRHMHSGEEFLYVIAGSTVISMEGRPDVPLVAGQGLRIPPRTAHWGKVGSEGMRAVSSWVKAQGQPLRLPAP